MWICLSDGFLSAVQDKDNPDCVLVRARTFKHLQDAFPDKVDKIFSRSGSDYAWRLRIKKETWSEFVAQKALDIDYGNFKNTVKDPNLKSWYSYIWYLGLEYQEAMEGYCEWLDYYNYKDHY